MPFFLRQVETGVGVVTGGPDQTLAWIAAIATVVGLVVVVVLMVVLEGHYRRRRR